MVLKKNTGLFHRFQAVASPVSVSVSFGRAERSPTLRGVKYSGLYFCFPQRLDADGATITPHVLISSPATLHGFFVPLVARPCGALFSLLPPRERSNMPCEFVMKAVFCCGPNTPNATPPWYVRLKDGTGHSYIS